MAIKIQRPLRSTIVRLQAD